MICMDNENDQTATAPASARYNFKINLQWFVRVKAYTINRLIRTSHRPEFIISLNCYTNKIRPRAKEFRTWPFDAGPLNLEVILNVTKTDKIWRTRACNNTFSVIDITRLGSSDFRFCNTQARWNMDINHQVIIWNNNF